jgi:Uma2 family endonuclease
MGRAQPADRESIMVIKFPPDVQHHRFTVDDYHRMIDLGILTEEHPLELIDGEVVWKANRRSPQWHGTAHIERYPFTADEYRRLLDAGILSPSDRVEVNEGELGERMTIGDAHCTCVDRCQDLLHDTIGRRGLVRIQSPIVLDVHEPEPDISVVHRRSDYYRSGKPQAADVLLLIEVADSSFDFDRDVKGPRYARNGIPEYWIVDLNTDTVLVHRGPQPDGTWATTEMRRRGDALAVAALPGVAVAVADILP